MDGIEFIEKSKKVHDNRYDYSLVKYKNLTTKVKIICPFHGIFKQTPNHHMSGIGCPICNESSGEKEIRIFLEKNNIKFQRNKRFVKCRNKRTLPFDFYLPEYNMCIEFDGKQYFQSVKFWNNNIKEQRNRDNIKTTFCINNNIKLLRIRYDEIILDKIKDLKLKNVR